MLNVSTMISSTINKSQLLLQTQTAQEEFIPGRVSHGSDLMLLSLTPISAPAGTPLVASVLLGLNPLSENGTTARGPSLHHLESWRTDL